VDDKFRLVFTWSGTTPSAEAYRQPEAEIHTTLAEAIRRARESAGVDHIPFISYKYMTFEPTLIEVLHQEFIARSV
jgi:hypothetical protein